MKENEILLYRANTAPSALSMFFLIFNTCQTIFTLNAVNPTEVGIRIMEIILLNILLSFLVFIAASEIKRYSIKWSAAALGIGVFQCMRYFLIPPVIQDARVVIVLNMLTAGFILIFASLWSLVICGRYRKVKKETE